MTISKELYRQALLAGRLVTFSAWDGGALRNLLPLAEEETEAGSHPESSPGLDRCSPAAHLSGSEMSSGQ